MRKTATTTFPLVAAGFQAEDVLPRPEYKGTLMSMTPWAFSMDPEIEAPQSPRGRRRRAAFVDDVEKTDPAAEKPRSALRSSTSFLSKRGSLVYDDADDSGDSRKLKQRPRKPGPHPISMTEGDLLDDEGKRAGFLGRKINRMFRTTTRETGADGDDDEGAKQQRARRTASTPRHEELPASPTMSGRQTVPEHSSSNPSSGSLRRSDGVRGQARQADAAHRTGPGSGVQRPPPVRVSGGISTVPKQPSSKASGSAIFKQLSPQLQGLSPRSTQGAMDWMKASGVSSSEEVMDDFNVSAAPFLNQTNFDFDRQGSSTAVFPRQRSSSPYGRKPAHSYPKESPAKVHDAEFDIAINDDFLSDVIERDDFQDVSIHAPKSFNLKLLLGNVDRVADSDNMLRSQSRKKAAPAQSVRLGNENSVSGDGDGHPTTNTEEPAEPGRKKNARLLNLMKGKKLQPRSKA